MFDRTASTKCIRDILKCYGLRTSTEEEKKEADRLKYCFVTYIWYPDNSLVLPEHEDEIYASIGGNEIKLGTLKNLTEDKMYCPPRRRPKDLWARNEWAICQRVRTWESSTVLSTTSR